MKLSEFIAYLKDLPENERSQFSKNTLENIHKPYDSFYKIKNSIEIDLVDVLTNISDVIEAFASLAITSKRNYLGYIADSLKLARVKETLSNEQHATISEFVKKAKTEAVKAVNSASKKQKKTSKTDQIEVVKEGGATPSECANASEPDVDPSDGDSSCNEHMAVNDTPSNAVIAHYISMIMLKDKQINELREELASVKATMAVLQANVAESAKNEGRVEVLQDQLKIMWEYMKMFKHH